MKSATRVTLDGNETNASVAQLESQALDVIRSVREAVTIPLAVKLSPFYSSLAAFARQIDEIGVDGLVIFNRFYQPDFNIEELNVERVVHLSDSSELLLRLRWLAILYGQIQTPMAVTGGVHTAVDVLKSVMAGASICQMASALLRHGPGYLTTIREETARWLEEHEYDSLAQARGSLSLGRVPDPGAYERASYAKILQTWDIHSL
ncbi:beta/alpha barrel domain-containing protein [Thalassoroseus pseudoceratinae]|uniref:hypothetical protein n=1 Tax=Thalassoroseus pseudoceratinae TaxID=2713176 RepID=UPI0014241453|nr:hypothetical protein [Thalassoroseus pseudoceratinae]